MRERPKEGRRVKSQAEEETDGWKGGGEDRGDGGEGMGGGGRCLVSGVDKTDSPGASSVIKQRKNKKGERKQKHGH